MAKKKYQAAAAKALIWHRNEDRLPLSRTRMSALVRAVLHVLHLCAHALRLRETSERNVGQQLIYRMVATGDKASRRQQGEKSATIIIASFTSLLHAPRLPVTHLLPRWVPRVCVALPLAAADGRVSMGFLCVWRLRHAWQGSGLFQAWTFCANDRAAFARITLLRSAQAYAARIVLAIAPGFLRAARHSPHLRAAYGIKASASTISKNGMTSKWRRHRITSVRDIEKHQAWHQHQRKSNDRW